MFTPMTSVCLTTKGIPCKGHISEWACSIRLLKTEVSCPAEATAITWCILHNELYFFLEDYEAHCSKQG